MDTQAPVILPPVPLRRRRAERALASGSGAPPATVMLPHAVLVVPLPHGALPRLPGLLASIADSRIAGGMKVARGALAVLVVAAEGEATVRIEAVGADYPFPLLVETGPLDAPALVRRAAAWASRLGAGTLPVLLADPGRPVPPRWAEGLLAALRDGADLVARPRSGWRRLLGGMGPPAALSPRAQWAMEEWEARASAPPASPSPWMNPARAGLRAVPG